MQETIIIWNCTTDTHAAQDRLSTAEEDGDTFALRKKARWCTAILAAQADG